jgi:hypothetical protein
VTRPLSPAFLITFAQALVDDAAMHSPASELTESAWSSTGFVHHAGYWSHFDHRIGTSAWPLPSTASCTDLAAFAATEGILVSDAPEAGDVYLLWSPSKNRFARAGIVIGRVRPLSYPSGRSGYECLTIDACTTRSGSIRGPHTAIVQRALSAHAGDRLIRWPMLEPTSYELPNVAESRRRRAA